MTVLVRKYFNSRLSTGKGGAPGQPYSFPFMNASKKEVSQRLLAASRPVSCFNSVLTELAVEEIPCICCQLCWHQLVRVLLEITLSTVDCTTIIEF